jgi:hypothetical protein
MQHITQVRKLPLWFLGAGVLTVLSGVGLYSRASGGFSNQWMHSGPGITFGIGAVFAILAVIVGMSVTSPTAKRVAALGQSMASAGKPPTPDQQAEMGRLQAGDVVGPRCIGAIEATLAVVGAHAFDSEPGADQAFVGVLQHQVAAGDIHINPLGAAALHAVAGSATGAEGGKRRGSQAECVAADDSCHECS